MQSRRRQTLKNVTAFPSVICTIFDNFKPILKIEVFPGGPGLKLGKHLLRHDFRKNFCGMLLHLWWLQRSKYSSLVARYRSWLVVSAFCGSTQRFLFNLSQTFSLIFRSPGDRCYFFSFSDFRLYLIFLYSDWKFVKILWLVGPINPDLSICLCKNIDVYKWMYKQTILIFVVKRGKFWNDADKYMSNCHGKQTVIQCATCFAFIKKTTRNYESFWKNIVAAVVLIQGIGPLPLALLFENRMSMCALTFQTGVHITCSELSLLK